MSTSSVNSTAGSNITRYTGLASGIDTDEIVEKLAQASQVKIDKVKQQQQILTWKQEDYRSIINDINTFFDKYFKVGDPSSSLMSGFYNSKKAVALNPSFSNYVTITPTSGTNINSISLGNVTVATAATAKSENSVSQAATINFANGPVDLTGKTFKIDVDGTTKTLTFNKSYNTAQDLADDIQSMTNTTFGSNKISVTTDGDNILLNSEGSAVTIQQAEENNAFTSTGLTLSNSSNRINMSKSLSDLGLAITPVGDTFEFTINDVEFTFDKSASLTDVINTINKSDAGVKVGYSSITDKFTMSSTKTGVANGITISDSTGNLMSSIFGTLTEDNYKAGTDASIEIDGVKVTRTTNMFTIDGITYNLKANTTESTTMNIETDVDKAYNNIKTFVDDYNALLDKLNSKLSEEKYKDYAPLTEAQKKDMSETQITAWEKKAKSGLLKNDSNISSLITTLRSALYESVYELTDNSKALSFNINSVGITTGEYKEKGKLVIDETKLRQALANDPDIVTNLFTQRSDKPYSPLTNTAEVRAERYKESGLMYRISDILQDYARKTQGGGSLLQIAGYSGTTTEVENTISKSIKSYNDRLNRLLSSLEREKTRYYNQFSAMEKYISQMNSQSAYLNNTLNY